VPTKKRKKRIEDLLNQQPTDLSALQVQWTFSSEREVEEYLRSELNAYYFRDGEGLVWASDKAETLIETIKKSTQEPSSDDLLDEIRRLNKELGQVPTRAEMTNRGSYT